MTQRIINIGTAANAKNGDPIRVAFDKANQNFSEIYTNLGLINNFDGMFPGQTGNGGKYLTTNGTAMSWATLNVSTGNYLFDGNNLYTNHAGETIISNGSWSAEDANADIRLPDKTEGGDIYLQNSSGGGVFLAGGSGSLNVAANGKIYISSSVIDGHAPAAWISAGADTILDSNGTVYTFGMDGTITVPPGKITTTVVTTGTTRLFDVPNPDMISGSLLQWNSSTYGTWGAELYGSGVVLEDVSSGATVQVIDSASGIVISSSTINGIGAQVTFSTHEALTGIGDGTFIRIIPLNYVPAVLHSYKISTGDYSNWIFSNDGILRLPNGATLGNSVFSGDPLGHTAVMSTYSGRNQVYVQDANAAIQTSGDGSTFNTWTFGNDGTLSLPDIGGYSIIQSTYAVELKAGIHSLYLDSSGNLTLDGNPVGGSSFNGVLNGVEDDTTPAIDFFSAAQNNHIVTLASDWTLKLKARAAGANQGHLWLEAGQNTKIKVHGNGSNIDVVASDGSTSATWNFAKTGALTFPNSTVQTTAYTGPGPVLSVYYLNNNSPYKVDFDGSDGIKIPYNTVVEDTDSGWDNVNTQYTCKRSGLYTVTASSGSVTNNNAYYIQLRSGTGNGNIVQQLYAGPPKSVMNGNVIVRLTKDTIYQIRILCGAGAAGDVYGGQYTTYMMLAHLRD